MKKRDLWVIAVAAFLLGLVAAARCEELRIKAWLTEDEDNIITVHSRVWSETSPPDSVVFLKRNPTRTSRYSEVYGWDFATADPVTFLDTENDSIGMAAASVIGHYLDMQLPYFTKLRVNDGGFMKVEATHEISHPEWHDPVLIDHGTPTITNNPSGTMQLAVTLETDVPSCISLSIKFPAYSPFSIYSGGLLGPATEHNINIDTGVVGVGGDAIVSVLMTDGYWCLPRGYGAQEELGTVSTTAPVGYSITVTSATWATPWCPDSGLARIIAVTDIPCGMKGEVKLLGSADWVEFYDSAGWQNQLTHTQYFEPITDGSCVLQAGNVYEGRLKFYYNDGLTTTPWYYTANFDFE